MTIVRARQRTSKRGNGRRVGGSTSPLGRYARDEIARTRSRTDRVIARPDPRAEELHNLHRDLRRLRVLVRWWAKIGPRPRREELRILAGRLRHLARVVGAVRDLDVELDLWEGLTGAGRAKAAEPWTTFGRHLRDSTRTGRELLRAALRAERAAGIFEQLETSLRGIGSSARLLRLIAELKRERGRLAAATAKARRKSLKSPRPKRLHDLRIRVRQLRYLTDLEDTLSAARASTFPPRYASLQRRLGELHDRDVLAAQLARLDPRRTEPAWRAIFDREREALRQDLLREIRELRPRRHLKRARGPGIVVPRPTRRTAVRPIPP